MIWKPGSAAARWRCGFPKRTSTRAAWLAERFRGAAWIAAELHCGPNDRARLFSLKEISSQSGLPLVAAGDVHMHLRSRRRLQDVLTAVRLGKPVRAVRARRCFRTPSATCGCACAWRSSTRRSCSPRRWRSPSAAVSRSMNCAMNTRTSWSPAARPRQAGCASSPKKACARRFPSGVPAKVARAGGARAQAHRRARLRAVLPHCARRGALRARRGDPVPGQGIGGEFGGVLCAAASPRSIPTG